LVFILRTREPRDGHICVLSVMQRRGLNATYLDQSIENDVTMTLVGSKFHEPPSQAPYARKQQKSIFVNFNFSEIQQIYHSKKKASI